MRWGGCGWEKGPGLPTRPPAHYPRLGQQPGPAGQVFQLDPTSSSPSLWGLRPVGLCRLPAPRMLQGQRGPRPTGAGVGMCGEVSGVGDWCRGVGRLAGWGMASKRPQHRTKVKPIWDPAPWLKLIFELPGFFLLLCPASVSEETGGHHGQVAHPCPHRGHQVITGRGQGCCPCDPHSPEAALPGLWRAHGGHRKMPGSPSRRPGCSRHGHRAEPRAPVGRRAVARPLEGPTVQ